MNVLPCFDTALWYSSIYQTLPKEAASAYHQSSHVLFPFKLTPSADYFQCDQLHVFCYQFYFIM